jgi:hypothetical protein
MFSPLPGLDTTNITSYVHFYAGYSKLQFPPEEYYL